MTYDASLYNEVQDEETGATDLVKKKRYVEDSGSGSESGIDDGSDSDAGAVRIARKDRDHFVSKEAVMELYWHADAKFNASRFLDFYRMVLSTQQLNNPKNVILPCSEEAADFLPERLENSVETYIFTTVTYIYIDN